MEDGRGVVTGATTHFSTVAAFGGALRFRMIPDDVTAAVGESWMSEADADWDPDVTPSEVKAVVGDRGVLKAERTTFRYTRDLDILLAEFRCISRGTDNFSMHVTVRERERGGEEGFYLKLLGIPSAKQVVVLPGTATCTQAGGTTEPAEEPKIQLGCAVWRHEGADTAFRIFAALTSVEPGEKATIRAEGVNGGEPITAPVGQDDQGLYVEFPGRIKEFGSHAIIDFSFEDEEGTVFDLTKAARRLIGDGEVDSEPEGTIGDCGSLERLFR